MTNPLSPIRRENFKKLFDERWKKQEEAAEALGIQPAYVSFLLTGRKDMGEKLARRMEKAAGLAPGYFDRDPSGLASDPMQLLMERFRASPPDVQALIQLALDDPNAPISDLVKPSLKVMLDMVRSQIKPHLPT